MMIGLFDIDIGPFAKAKKDAENFGHNLILTHALGESAKNMMKIQEEYDEALANSDDVLAAKKLLELQTYKSSIALTAHMFEQHDKIST